MIVDTDDLVSHTDIARMAEVSPAAVSNWVKRHENFPKPVAVFANGKFKVYLWSEIREWLTTPRTITYERPARVVTRTLPAKFRKEEETS